MGEIADMMLEGELCEGCGVYLDGEGDGYPRRCPDCGPMLSESAEGAPLRGKIRCIYCPRTISAAGLKDHMDAKHPGVKHDAKTRCTVCNKPVKTVGLSQHMRDAHGA